MISCTSNNTCNVYPLETLSKKLKMTSTKPQKKNHLLKFILSVTESENYSSVIRWTDEDKTVLQFVRPNGFAQLYGASIGKPQWRYDDVARHFRHYKAKGIVSKVEGVTSTWRFHCSPIELANGSGSQSTVSPIQFKRTREEATPEELELVMEALKENLAPFDKFLSEHKEIQQLEFQEQIDCYLKSSG